MITEVKIEEGKEFEIVVKIYEVDNGKGNSIIPSYWDEYLEKYDSEVAGMLGVCIPDGAVNTAKGKFAYGIGNFKERCAHIPEGFTTLAVPAALWGKFYTKGKMPAAIQNLWHEVLNKWIPSSEYRAVGGFDFEYYTDGDATSDDYVSGIWVMLERR